MPRFLKMMRKKRKKSYKGLRRSQKANRLLSLPSYNVQFTRAEIRA